MTDYSTLEYWNQRFARDKIAFEWLRRPEDLLPILRQLSESIPPEQRRILHIGPGSSALALHLRELVSLPSRIHNVDFSQASLQIGQELELNVMGSHREGKSQDLFMTWIRINLLDVKDVHHLKVVSKQHGAYNLIMDKSTSDAIACGAPVEMDRAIFDDRMEAAIPQPEPDVYKLYPVWCLALHLAVVTEPGAFWISVSYKEDRFCFLDRTGLPLDLNGRDLPLKLMPAHYWTLHGKEFITDGTAESGVLVDTPIHRPVEGQWVIVLQRSANVIDLK